MTRSGRRSLEEVTPVDWIEKYGFRKVINTKAFTPGTNTAKLISPQARV